MHARRVAQAKGLEGSRSSWVAVLQSGAYRDLTTEQRVAALSALCHAVMEGPAVRAAMDARLDEAHNRRRLQHQETRVRFRQQSDEPLPQEVYLCSSWSCTAF